MARRKQKSPGFTYVGKRVETSAIRFDKDVFIEKAKANASGGLTTLAFDSNGKVIKEFQPRRINNLPDSNAAFVVSDFFQSGINLNLAEGTTGGVTADRTHQMPTATEFANNALSDILTSFEFIIVNLDDEFNVEPTTNTGLTLIGSMRVSPGTSATFACIRTSSKSTSNAVTVVRTASDAFDPAEVGDITAVVAGTNLTGGATTGSATINLADASTSVKGAASFSSDNFAASSGAITIKDGGVDLTAEVTGVLPSANLDADTAHLSTTQTFTGAKTFDETISGSINGNAATVTTNANLTGHVTSSGNAAVLGSFTVSQLNTAISNATISGNNTGDQTNVSGSSGSCTGNAATATNLTASTSTAVGLGTIELGHATDTTIARSAAGKVTIESAPIQTTQMSMTHHHFFMNSSSTTADFFFPYNNLNEASSTSQYYTRTIAPYDGKIVKVLIRPVSAIGTACKLQFHKITNTTASFGTAVEEVTSINLNTAQTSVSTAFSSATFDAGDVIGVSLIKSASGTSNVQAVIVWEYTV